MKNLSVLPWALVVAGLIAIAPGCASLQGGSDPQAVYVEVNESYRTVVDSLRIFYEGGKIDQETWETVILPMIEEGDALMDRYEEALLAGEVDLVEILRPAVRGIVIRLSVYLASQ